MVLMRVFGTLLQLVPMGFVALLVLILSGGPPRTSGPPGVSFFVPWLFAYSIALAFVALAALVSTIAGVLAAFLTAGAFGIGAWMILATHDGGFGMLLAGSAGLSLLGWFMRVRATRRPAMSRR
jgi:hypothetical protein